jgi:hypothetical protein
MTIYDLPGLPNMYLNFAATRTNIKAGFLATGIFPYNRDIFPDEEFLSCYVTDRPATATDPAASNESLLPLEDAHQHGSCFTSVRLVAKHNKISTNTVNFPIHLTKG